MKLKNIDKQKYKKNFNQLVIVVIASLVLGALGISQLLIYLLSDREGSHFLLNITGVGITVFLIVVVINHYRRHPFMREIVYVWELKQALNRIYRKQRKLNAAIEQCDKDALTALYFSYQGSKQLYTLDDNTITLDDLERSLRELEAKIEACGYKIRAEDYDPAVLDRF